MKASKLLLAIALFTGIAAISYAGPGPQFWAQQARNAKEPQAKVDAPVKAEPTAQVVACANCNCAGMKKS